MEMFGETPKNDKINKNTHVKVKVSVIDIGMVKETNIDKQRYVGIYNLLFI